VIVYNPTLTKTPLKIKKITNRSLQASPGLVVEADPPPDTPPDEKASEF
jgi:hypothetical protein